MLRVEQTWELEKISPASSAREMCDEPEESNLIDMSGVTSMTSLSSLLHAMLPRLQNHYCGGPTNIITDR